jgi:hypothetical protein
MHVISDLGHRAVADVLRMLAPGVGGLVLFVTVISTVSHPGVTSAGRKTLSMARAFSDDLLAQEPA